MTMPDFDRPFQWYQDFFARELDLQIADPDAGLLMGDPAKLEAIADHYLNHPEYSRVGREMLLVPLLDCLHYRLAAGPLSPGTCDLVRKAIGRAMNDEYDRDALRPLWATPDLPNDPNPVGTWMRAQFPDWTPPPSVWSQ